MIKYEKIVNDHKLPIKFISFNENNVKPVEKHWHNSLEIVVPVSGNHSVCWLDGNEIDIYPSEKEKVIIINSQSIHAFSGAEGQYVGYALQINYQFVRNLYPQLDEFYFEQPDEELSRLLREQVYRINYYYHYDSQYKNLVIYASIANILFALFDQLASKKSLVYVNKSTKNKKRISEMTNYIDEFYYEDINLDELSIRFGLSKQHILKLFRENIGTTVKSYLTSVRLRHAKDDLLNFDLPLIDIAIKNGFPNLQSLNRAFVEKCHMTASQYRKKMNE